MSEWRGTDVVICFLIWIWFMITLWSGNYRAAALDREIQQVRRELLEVRKWIRDQETQP